MNNEMTLTREQKLDIVLNRMAYAVNRPLRKTTAYYSHVLQRKLSTRQTLCLLNAQLAFFMTVFPTDCSILLRILCACWLVKALLKCKEVL